jgi:hypothetical protein
MGCPFHGDGPGGERETGESSGGRTLDRREFVRAALTIGGVSALGSLGSLAGVTTTVRAAGEPIGAAARSNRQHAWDAFEPRNDAGHTAPPPHALFLMLDYGHAGEPTRGHRRTVERALTGIERRFEWGPDGVLFTMGYSASYFDRFEEPLPEGARPDSATTVAERVAELTDLADTNDAMVPDDYDAVLLLASTNAANLLAVEAALWGEEGAGIEFEDTFEGVFAKPEGWPERRVGFAGAAFQEREEEYEEAFLDGADVIPDDTPLSMGFIAGFGGSIPHEDTVTLESGQVFPGPGIDEADVPTDLQYVDEVGERDPGVFAQGTLKHISHVELDLPKWYAEDPDRRRHQMYSPYHTEAETNAEGGDRPGSGLVVDDPGPDDEPDSERYTVEEYADRTETTARGDDSGEAETDQPTVGHSQKTARARYDVDGRGKREQIVLRRDWDTITPTGDGATTAGYLFNVPMRFNESIYSLLDATYNVAFRSLDGRVEHTSDASVDTDVKERNGIAPYMTATRRGNWLVPPITLRALPYPRAAEATLSAELDGDSCTVEVSAVEDRPARLDPATIRFGLPADVDRAGGARPTEVSHHGGTVTCEFTGVAVAEDDVCELFAKERGSRRPVVGTVTL